MSVLNYQHGHFIDSFPNVIRFNGFEKYKGDFSLTGQKTTGCVFNTHRNTLRDIAPRLPHLAKKYKLYITATRRANLFRASGLLRTYNADYESICLNPGKVFDEWGIKVVHPPSSGFMLIWHHLKQGKKVCIHGFDLIDPSTKGGELLHYFAPENQKIKSEFSGRHNMEREAIMINEMIDKGLVIPLNDYRKEIT